MKKILLLVVTLVVLFVSCDKKEKETPEGKTTVSSIGIPKIIPDDFFTVKTEMLKADFFPTYKAEIGYGYFTNEYSLQYNDFNDIVIQYDKEGIMYYIVTRRFNNEFRSLYYFGEIGGDNLDLNKNIIFYSNLDSAGIRFIEPRFVNKIKQEKIKKIILDFNWKVENLDFFNHIKLIK